MIRALLRAIRDACQHALERLDPVAETPTIPPPLPEVTGWFYAELVEQFDMRGVDRVLARWASEGVPPEMLEEARRREIDRRVWSDRRLTSWQGGSA